MAGTERLQTYGHSETGVTARLRELAFISGVNDNANFSVKMQHMLFPISRSIEL